MTLEISRRKVLAGLATGTGLAVLGWSPRAQAWVVDPLAPEAGDVIAVPELEGTLILPSDVAGFTEDFGHLVRQKPRAVLTPKSVKDIARVVAYAAKYGIKVAVNGQSGPDGARESHSQYGQALVDGGIAINLKPLATIHSIGTGVANVGAGCTWAQLVKATFATGQRPPVLNDMIHLSIGGTLSVGGLGGTSGRFGTQADNVKEIDVVTGRGELLTCSPSKNPELFEAVLAGGGQCGLIVRAVLKLIPAKPMVRFVDLIYTDQAAFLRDSVKAMRSSLVEDQNGYIVPGTGGGWQYLLSLAVSYTPPTVPDTSVLGQLSGTAGPIADMPHLDWLFRFDGLWAQLKQQGFWAAKKPWVSVMVAATEAPALLTTVLGELKPDQLGAGITRMSPMNASVIKRQAFMLPRRSAPEIFEMTMTRFPPPDYPDINGLLAQNRRFYNKTVALGGKRYLIGAIPNMSQQDWKTHYGDRWATVQALKAKYDPSNVLTPGQKMFP
jgi:cytokinin dehydrogenase